MEEAEKPVLQEEEKKTYSESEMEKLKAELRAEFELKEEQIKKEAEEQIKKTGMSELELARAELEEIKKKYREKEDECQMAKEKEETIVLLDEAGISPVVLDLVYEFKDMSKTKMNIETLKNFLQIQKQEFLQNYMNTPVVEVSNGKEEYDPFIEGFDTNTL